MNCWDESLNDDTERPWGSESRFYLLLSRRRVAFEVPGVGAWRWVWGTPNAVLPSWGFTLHIYLVKCLRRLRGENCRPGDFYTCWLAHTFTILHGEHRYSKCRSSCLLVVLLLTKFAKVICVVDILAAVDPFLHSN